MHQLYSRREISEYPRISAIKSKWNQLRQKMLNMVTQWLQKRSSEATENMYLNGVYRPCEEVKVEKLELKTKIKGEIPQQLSGILLRIGPNPIHVAKPALHHWFSGDGMIHGLKIINGEIEWFKSRYIATDTICKAQKKEKTQGFRRGPADIINTNAFYFSGKIWASIEAGTFPACLDSDLNTERHQFFNTDADLPFTAHPHIDPRTGHLHAICYDALELNFVFYEVLNDEGKLIHLTKIPVRHGPMIHDCAITQNEILVFDFPVTFSKKQVLRGNSLPYEWNDDHPARIGVLPLYGQANEIKWYEVRSDSFVFHAANAYCDEHRTIALDVIVHNRMFDLSKQGPFEQQKTQLERWFISPYAQHIQQMVLDTETQEFPRIDERYTGQKYRYLYTVSFNSAGLSQPNQLFIHDLDEQKKQSYSYGNEWITGEVIFIAASEQAKEGQGYLFSYVHHVNGLASKVVILKVDGLDIQEQAEIDLGVRVPLGFHGNWVDLS